MIKILKMIAMYYFKKYGTELIFDAVIEAAEKSASLTATNLDDNAVAKFKADKHALLSLIKSL